LHQEHERIEWTEPHGSRDVVNCKISLAKKGSYPAACVPRCRQIRIKRKRTIDQHFQVTSHASERKPAGAELQALLDKGADVNAKGRRDRFTIVASIKGN
jgi:hypothetical protein